MKKNLFVLVFLSLIISSCSSSDGDNSNDSRLIGKWNYHQETNIINGVESIHLWPHACSSIKDNVEFFSNGNYKESSYLNNCQLDSNNSGNGSWTLNGNNLTINIWGDIYTYQVVTLNNDILKLKTTYDIQPGYPEHFEVFTKN